MDILGIVAIECLGDINGPRYLDGRTREGTVGLAPSIEGYSGTQWRLRASGSSITLECLGDIDGPRYLDGRTREGTVGLVPSAEGFSGAKWERVSINDFVVFKCMGDIEGPRFLDGRTAEGAVALVNQYNTPELSGTRWKLHPLADEQDNFPIGIIG